MKLDEQNTENNGNAAEPRNISEIPPRRENIFTFNKSVGFAMALETIPATTPQPTLMMSFSSERMERC